MPSIINLISYLANPMLTQKFIKKQNPMTFNLKNPKFISGKVKEKIFSDEKKRKKVQFSDDSLSSYFLKHMEKKGNKFVNSRVISFSLEF